MATELGSAFISVGLSTKGLGGDIKKMFNGADGAGSDAGKRAGGGFKAGFVGMIAGAVGALGIGTFLKGAVSEASGLGESINAVNVVFGKASKGVQQLGKESAKSLGLSNLEFNNLAVRFSSFAGSIAGPGGDVTGTLKAMTGRAADFASVMNLEVADAAQLFQSGLAGESEPLRQYGIDLSAAAVEAYALEKGITTSAGSMTEAEKVQARYGLLMEKTSMAAGDFANTSGSLANQQRILSASWKNAQATIGTALLPAISAVTGALIKGLDPAVAGTQKVIKEITGGFHAFGAAFKAADGDITSNGFAGVMEHAGFIVRQVVGGFWALSAAYKAADGDITSSGFAGFMERVGFAVREVTGGVRAMFAAFKAGDGDITSSGFAGFMEQVGGTARQVFNEVGAAFSRIWTTIGPQISALIPILFQLFQALSPTSLIFQALLPVLPQLAAAIGGVIAMVLPLVLSLASQLLPIVTQLVASVLPPLIDIFGNIVTSIVPVIGIIVGLLIPIIKALMPVVVTVFGVVANVVKSAMQIVQGVIQVVTGIIQGNWSRVWTGIGNIFAGIWNTIKAVVSGAIRIVGSYISAGLGLASGTVRNILGNIGRFFADTWNNIVNGVSGMIGRVTGFFGGLIGKITGAIGNAGGALIQTGKDIVQGLIDGIGSMMGSIGRAVISIVPQAIRGPFEKLLGINSPSKVFREYGANIGQGLVLGIDGMHGKVANSVTGLVSVPSVPTYRAGAYTAAGSSAPAAGGGVTINGNVGWDPHQVAQEIEVQKRRSLTMAGMGGVVFA